MRYTGRFDRDFVSGLTQLKAMGEFCDQSDPEMETLKFSKETMEKLT